MKEEERRKRVREEEEDEEEDEDKTMNVYDEEQLEEMLKNDEITEAEYSFMLGREKIGKKEKNMRTPHQSSLQKTSTTRTDPPQIDYFCVHVKILGIFYGIAVAPQQEEGT